MSVEAEEYENQLQYVEQALLSATDLEYISSLQSLRNDILQLIELTGSASTDSSSQNNYENDFDREMRMFESEIRQLDTDANLIKEAKPDDKEKSKILMHKLGLALGDKCSAPHKHTWGSLSYHNAFICSIEELDNTDNEQLYVRVLFINPTHRDMLPCTYFLDGECRFTSDRCHFSHGELVEAMALRNYVVPDFERLTENYIVLAKLEDRLWHRGRVLYVNLDKQSCQVRLDSNEHNVREREFKFEDLYPMFIDEDDVSNVASSNETSNIEIDDTPTYAKEDNRNLFSYKSSQPMGDWEKYTRGIGSKIMLKMGYIKGQGLGSDGAGIITPVPVQVLPQGCSLDYCMNLRENANGDKDIFNPERKRLRTQKKQEELNIKNYESDLKNTSSDIFSFLNDNVLSRYEENPTNQSKKNKKPLIQTTKEINVELLQISDEIRKKRREISGVVNSMNRNVNSKDVTSRLSLQLNVKNNELQNLKSKERSLTNEVNKRKSTQKISVF